MKTRDIILGSYVALSVLSCVRDKPTDDAGTPPSSTTPGAKPIGNDPVGAVDAAKPALAPSAVAYDDKNDLPANAGEARCKDPIPANAKPASVKVELTSSPPGIELAIPSLGIQQRLWPNSTPPKECRATLEAGGASLRFRCSDATSAVDAKLYSRTSDVVIGRATTTGTGTTKFVLPCGTPAKLEPIVCPKECKKEGDLGCSCGAK